jgi:hypothetical protein
VKFYLRDYDGALSDLDKAHKMEPTSSSILRYWDVSLKYPIFYILIQLFERKSVVLSRLLL